MNIDFDEIREDVRRADGSLIQADVLFIRGRTEVMSPDNIRQTIEYHCPIWEESLLNEEYDIVSDVKDMLAVQIGKHIQLHGYRAFGWKELIQMALTTDPDDPRLGRGVGGEGMNEAYLVLSDEERAKGFVRPVRLTYIHAKELGGCGVVTTMNQSIAETYARSPGFYGATYCFSCRTHLPVGEHGEFYWDGTTEKVGT